jgi:NAD-dependent SIR2 family protein deacetylase
VYEEISKAKEVIKKAKAILITAGAGMGVDSGLPDFRGKEGFWKAYPIIEKLDLDFVSMANPKWFFENPKLAWAFYGHRLNLYRNTIPHKGFKLLLELVKRKNDNYFIFTSNVDGQFQKAGFDEDKIFEVHGSIHYLQCTKNCKNKIWEAKDEYIQIDMNKFEATNIPLCKDCKAVARPNILMFGDWEYNDKRAVKQQAKYNKWKKANKTEQIVVIELGAGTAVPTVRLEGESLAKNLKATLLRINPRDFEINVKNGISLKYKALEGLEKLLTV